MSRHALAFVEWDTLRSGPGKHPAFRANFYRCPNRRIYKLDGGGTLWVVTSLVNSEGETYPHVGLQTGRLYGGPQEADRPVAFSESLGANTPSLRRTPKVRTISLSNAPPFTTLPRN